MIRVASVPFRTGMPMSMRTTSGLFSIARRTASRPSSTSATTFMSARYPHGELRPAAGQRLNLEMTADCLRTFSHRHHAESRFRRGRSIFYAIEADSVVLHGHNAFAVRMIERNFDAASAGMLCDVVERFLGDAKKRDLDLKCRS